MSVRNGLVFLLSGFTFGLGLIISGMTQPAKVVGFFDYFGDWDPSLAFVMGGALLVFVPAFQRLKARGVPFMAHKLHLPERNQVDGKLVAGALLFGIGWGVGGFCPGPALVSAGAVTQQAMFFVPAMLVGMALHRVIFGGLGSDARRRGASAAGASA
mgnify:CR=1 FL=1